MESFEQWILRVFEPEEIVDIVTQGASAGYWDCLSKRKELANIYDIHHEEIWDILMHVYGGFPQYAQETQGVICNAWTLEQCMVWEAVDIIAKKITEEP